MSNQFNENSLDNLINTFDQSYLVIGTNKRDEQMLKKQLEKARLFFEHVIFQKEAVALRTFLNIPEDGFTSEDDSFAYITDHANQVVFLKSLSEFVRKYNISNRWFSVFGYYVLMNDVDIPNGLIPSVVEMYVPNSRDRVMLEIFKDTKIEDVKEAWHIINQQQLALKPNNKTRSKKEEDLMVWNESVGKFEFVKAAPAKRLRKSLLLKRGKEILESRAVGMSDKEIAREIKSNKILTAKDVADIVHDYKSLLKQMCLH